MHPYETAGIFLLQVGQRLFQQKLAITGAYRDVLEFGPQVEHVGHRNERDPAALGYRQIGSRFGRRGAQHVEPQRREGADPRQRVEQPPQADRLEQIVDRMQFECGQRVIVVGRGEDHPGSIRQAQQMARRLETVHLGHANVEQNHIGLGILDQFEQLDTGAGFAHQFDRQAGGAVVEQVAQPAPGGRLIIRNDHPQRIGISTHLPSPPCRRPSSLARLASRLRRGPARWLSPTASSSAMITRNASGFRLTLFPSHRAHEYGPDRCCRGPVTRASPRHRNAAPDVRGCCRAPSCCRHGAHHRDDTD